MPNLQQQRQELSARSTLQISAIVRRGWTLACLTASRRWAVVSLGLSHILTLAEVHFLYWKLGGKQIN